jgi:hypothetical protein
MKGTSTLLLASLTGCGMLLAGCSTISPRQNATLQAASDRYATVALDMSREELVRTLGPPQQDGARLLMWKVQYGSDNFELLGVELDSANLVAAIASLHSRFAWPRDDRFLAFAAPIPFVEGHDQQRGDLVIRPGYRPTEIRKLPGFPDSYYRAIPGYPLGWHYRST